MTTPAVNVDTTTFRPRKHETTNWNGTNWSPPVVSDDGNLFDVKIKDVRPASASSAKVDGWRNCLGWTHGGWKWNRGGGNNRRQVRFSANNITVNTYSDGSFWNLSAPATISGFPSGLINKTLQKALLKVQDSKLDLGVFLAEANKTANLVGNTAFTIARQVMNFRRNFPRLWRDVKRWQNGNCLRQNWKRIPRKWLELQYGWNPLLQDIYGAAAHLDKEQSAEGAILHVEANCRDEEMLYQTVTGGPGNESSCRLKYRIKRQCQVGLYYFLNNGTLAELSSLGLINPAVIVWELVPYSFVVDWIVPVGSWLQSLTAASGYSFKGGYRSMLSKMRCEGLDSLNLRNDFALNGVTTQGGGPIVNGDGAFDFARVCYTSSPVPGVYIKNPVSTKHMLNGLALLSLAFRG